MKENDKKLKNLKGEVPLRAPVTQRGGDFIRALVKTVTEKNKSVPCFHPQMNRNSPINQFCSLIESISENQPLQI